MAAEDDVDVTEHLAPLGEEPLLPKDSLVQPPEVNLPNHVELDFLV